LGGQGAATVVVAIGDDHAREMLARVVEAEGHHAVRLDDVEAPTVVDTTVQASALALVVDVTAVGLDDLAAVIDAFATRRYPAEVVALVDGPASADLATAAGARHVLTRPFPQHAFVAALVDLLGVAEPDRDGRPDVGPEAGRSGEAGAEPEPDKATPEAAGDGAHAATDVLPDDEVDPVDDQVDEDGAEGAERERADADQATEVDAAQADPGDPADPADPEEPAGRAEDGQPEAGEERAAEAAPSPTGDDHHPGDGDGDGDGDDRPSDSPNDDDLGSAPLADDLSFTDILRMGRQL
jgi:hypothetical protein